MRIFSSGWAEEEYTYVDVESMSLEPGLETSAARVGFHNKIISGVTARRVHQSYYKPVKKCR